jgi:hypothetical protein
VQISPGKKLTLYPKYSKQKELEVWLKLYSYTTHPPPKIWKTSGQGNKIGIRPGKMKTSELNIRKNRSS